MGIVTKSKCLKARGFLQGVKMLRFIAMMILALVISVIGRFIGGDNFVTGWVTCVAFCTLFLFL